MSGPGTNGGLASYRVSKAALNALTKNLSVEQGADTIVWLATREEGPTGLLSEDRETIPW